MSIWFGPKPEAIANREEWVACTGFSVSIGPVRSSVTEISLAGLVVSNPPAGVRQGRELSMTVHLPMAFGERSVTASVAPVRGTAERAVCVFHRPEHDILMSIRQVILGLRNNDTPSAAA